MRRAMALKKRGSQLRNQLRAAIHLAFPELHPLIKDLTQPTSLRFLQANPTPESIVRNGRSGFLDAWQPRRRGGQWRPETFQQLYDLDQHSSGLTDPTRIDAGSITALAYDLADTLTKHQCWLTQAITVLDHRADFQLLMQLPRIGQPTAAAIVTAIGDIEAYTNGQQLVNLAGLDLRVFA